jgi:hypothetical protein
MSVPQNSSNALTSATKRDFENLQNLADNPEVKSFIHQMTLDFLPYVTPSTVISVVAMDATLLHRKLKKNGKSVSKAKLSEYHRIQLSLVDEGARISSEGLDKNIYVAMKKAKEKMLSHLAQIQNTVMSEQERLTQLRLAQQSKILH